MNCYTLLTDQMYSIIEFEVVPTSLVVFDGIKITSRIVQPWISGQLFKSLSSTDSSSAQASLKDALNAFSHFSFEFSKRQSVLVEFEGK